MLYMLLNIVAIINHIICTKYQYDHYDDNSSNNDNNK